jgi:hypothetical protein
MDVFIVDSTDPGPFIVETVHYGWIVIDCLCTCDPNTGEWWSICSRHGVS